MTNPLIVLLWFSDSSNSGGDNMYTLMKPAGGNMGGVSAKWIESIDEHSSDWSVKFNHGAHAHSLSNFIVTADERV